MSTKIQSEIPLDHLFHGDVKCLLKSLPDECVDLVVSSPPYNLGKEYEAKKSLDIYLEEQSEILHECTRILKQTGSIFWQVGAFSDRGLIIPLDIRFFPILEECGLLPRNRIIWVRQHGVHARRKFSCRHETILWFTKSNDYIFNLDPVRVPQKYQNKKHYRGERWGELSCNPKGKNPGDIWVFRNVKHNHEEQTIHPCQFPEDLVARIILATTNENQIVFDPFMGVGTIAVVARDNSRHFIGAEIDSRYYSVALRRLRGEPDEKGKFPNLKTLRDYADRTDISIEEFGFDVQVGKHPTERSKAKIHSETYHRDEMVERLQYEEDCFGAKLRGQDEPVHKKYEQHKPRGQNFKLFT